MDHLLLRGKDLGAAMAAPVIIFLKRHYLLSYTLVLDFSVVLVSSINGRIKKFRLHTLNFTKTFV